MKILALLLALFSSPLLWAQNSSVQAGVGMTSFTSGRQIPALNVGYESTSFAASFTSAGYRTKYDYLSGYILSGFKAFAVGDFIGAPTRAGIGLGLYYSQRGYREALDANVKSVNDFGVGPAFRVGIYPFSFMYLRLETMLAISSPNNILLVFQDMSQLTLGVYW